MTAAATVTMPFEVTDLTPVIGTEVKMAAETLLSGRYAAQVRALLERRSVLAFRRMNLDDEQQVEFTATLGELQMQVGDKVINVSLDRAVNRERADYQRANEFWHLDMTSAETPNFASVMTARKLSEVGGETEFASTYAAWDELPDAEKKLYGGLRVMHALEASQYKTNPEPTAAQIAQWRTVPSRVHPLVWTHRSGRKSLVIGSTAFYVIDKTPEESTYILARLREWATQPQFVYRHRWTLGDLVVWDNTGTIHRALPYPADSGRLMRRTTIRGEEPVA
jgi:alpha-ketoglutarate-dependent taurine dioxygenase